MGSVSLIFGAGALPLSGEQGIPELKQRSQALVELPATALVLKPSDVKYEVVRPGTGTEKARSSAQSSCHLGSIACGS